MLHDSFVTNDTDRECSAADSTAESAAFFLSFLFLYVIRIEVQMFRRCLVIAKKEHSVQRACLPKKLRFR